MRKLVAAFVIFAMPALAQMTPTPPTLEQTALAITAWVAQTAQELASLRAQNAALRAENEKLKALPKPTDSKP